MKKDFSKKALTVPVLFFFSISLNPLSLSAAEIAPQQTAIPQQGEITPEAAQARTQASPAESIPSGAIPTSEASPLSAPSLTEKEMKAQGKEAVAFIKQTGAETIKTLQKDITAMTKDYKGTPLEKLTADIQQSLKDTDASIKPQTKRADDLLKIINSTAQTFDAKTAAYDELNAILQDFTEGIAAQQMNTLKENTQYLKDTGDILMPMWTDANNAYNELVKAGADFKAAADNLLKDLKNAAREYADITVMKPDIDNLIKGLTDDLARITPDKNNTKSILDSIIGTRNPNDVRARLKNLKDAVTAAKNFYAGEITSYTAELASCELRAGEIKPLLDEGKSTLNTLENQSAILIRKIDDMTNDLAQLKKTQSNESFNALVKNMEIQLADMKAQLAANNTKGEQLYADMQKRRSTGELKSLGDQIKALARQADSKSPENLAFAYSMKALEKDYAEFNNLAAAFDDARKTSTDIDSRVLDLQVNLMGSSYDSLGDVSEFPESKTITKGMKDITDSIQKDKDKTKELLLKVLKSRNTAEANKLLEEMRGITKKFETGPLKQTPDCYNQRVESIRTQIDDLRLKKLKQKVLKPLKK